MAGRGRVVRCLVATVAVAVVTAGCAAGDGDAEITDVNAIGAPVTTEPVPVTDSSPDTTQPATTDAPPVSDPNATDPTVPPEPAPPTYTYDEITSLALEEIPAYWRAEFPAIYGSEYEELAGGVWALRPDTVDLPDCGGETVPYEYVQGNAFYASTCDIIVYDDADLVPLLYDEFGPLVVATVFAHEWGHAIQARAGTNEATIIMEQQADCFAGSWVRSMYDDGTGLDFTPDTLTSAILGLIFVRDPPGLTGIEDPRAHGSAFDRVSAFRDGFNNGAPQCATYPESPPALFEFPFDAVDVETGGNLPLDQLLPLVEQSLDTYWRAVYEFNNLSYEPLAGGLIPYGDGVSEPPACGDADLDDDFYDANVFYCADGDYIAFDEPGLLEPLHSGIGDFAPALLIANAFAERVQTQLDVGLEGKERSLQADCMSGAWIRDLMFRSDQGTTDIRLSAGDLDEAVGTFLEYGDRAEPGAAQVYGTPFERLDQFRSGLVADLSACGI